MATSGQPEQSVPAQGEAQLYTQVMRSFKGVNTKATRSAIPPDTFADLENVIPIGDANLHVVDNISAALYNFAGHAIYAAQYGTVAGVGYVFAYGSDGTIIAVNLNTNVGSVIASAHPSSGVRGAPWYNQYMLFVDSAGYYSWNGTTFATLSLPDGPTGGSDIAVYGGRVWVSSARLVIFTAAYIGTTVTDPTQDTAWQVAQGGGFINFTDPALIGNLTRLWAQNGFLYFFGSTYICALSDIYVPAGANPPTPVYVLTPLQSIIGTNQPFSVFPFARALMLANSYGVWAIQGVTAQRISEDIDGTFQYLSSTANISGGQCVVGSILNAGFLIQRSNDPIFGSNTVIAMFFDGKWWFANFGTITFLIPVVVGSEPALMALIGNQLYQLFADPSTAPATTVMTPLWDLDDPLSDKQALRAGFEMVTSLLEPGYSVAATIDTFNGSTQLPITSATGQLVFVNGSGGAIIFTGLALAGLAWTVGSYQLYQAAAPGTWSKYIGMTIQTTGAVFELDSFLIDFKKRKRW